MNIATALAPPVEVNEEFHEFEVDKNIVSDLIHSQNGTISTALRELVMNAIDAGSTTCEITLTPNHFSVKDTGAGFQNRHSVETFFKRFGAPHQEGDAIFGRFRIGRGQIMSFGEITWHSNEFKMITDINRHGNGFKLIENPDDAYSGCHVHGTFYQPISEWDLREAQNELKKLVKHASLDITFNGIEIASLSQSETVWDYEDDELKIKWNPNRVDGIHLYSLGIFVKEVNRYQYGVNADIVTKKALMLNMARNEINDTDPLWRNIRSQLKSKALEVAKQHKNSRRMDEMTRRSIINQLMSGDLLLKDTSSLYLLKDCRGHTIPLSALWERKMPFSIAPDANNRIASAITTRKTALVLHYDELRLWGVASFHHLLNAIDEMSDFETPNYRGLPDVLFIPFDQLAAGFSETLETLTSSQLSPREQAAKNALQYACPIMSKRMSAHSEYVVNKRKIIIGESQVADGWTDGITYIAVNKSMLSLLDKGYYGAVQLAMLLLHEYCHDSHDTGSHEHDAFFFERFHDLSSTYRHEIIGHTADSLYQRYLSELQNKYESLPKAALKSFKYPIINECINYTGVMHEKKLSPLARILLDASGVKYTLSKKQLTANRKRTNHGEIYRVMAKLTALMIADGMELLDEGLVREQAKTIEIANDKLNKDFHGQLMRWGQKHHHSSAALSHLSHGYPSDRRGFSTVLQAICLDEHSGLVCFEYQQLISVSTLGSGKHLIDKPSHFLHRNYLTNEDVTAQKQTRFNLALTEMKRIVNGLSCPKERQQFIDTFLSHNLAAQLEVAHESH